MTNNPSINDIGDKLNNYELLLNNDQYQYYSTGDFRNMNSQSQPRL